MPRQSKIGWMLMLALALGLLGGRHAAAAGQIYKCADGKGGTTFSETPCKATEKELGVKSQDFGEGKHQDAAITDFDCNSTGSMYLTATGRVVNYTTKSIHVELTATFEASGTVESLETQKLWVKHNDNEPFSISGLRHGGDNCHVSIKILSN